MESDTAPSVIERLLTPRELAWLVTGVHEAGHMVAAFEGGLEVDYTEIHQGWFTNSTDGVVWYKEQEFEDEKRLPRLISCFSGSVAHERFLVEYGVSSSEAARDARDSSDFDMENLRYFLQGTNYSRNYVRSLSEQLVDRCWPRIVLLGTIICEKKRLSAAQAERVAG